jgi:hypothetical protein
MTQLQRIKQQRAENSLEIGLWNVIEKHKINPLSIASVLIEMGLSIITRINYKLRK